MCSLAFCVKIELKTVFTLEQQKLCKRLQIEQKNNKKKILQHKTTTTTTRTKAKKKQKQKSFQNNRTRKRKKKYNCGVIAATFNLDQHKFLFCNAKKRRTKKRTKTQEN